MTHDLILKSFQATGVWLMDADPHGGAVFYSPRKLASARARKAAELDEAAELQLKKTRDREARAAEAAHKKQNQEAAKVAQQQARIKP
ncbi:uncharacterized protein M421DRAFT_425606 [Didymella exigua CBS 183.55]|uniref:Uncharacterized protein n=1 Tax=Didymella exigua CBS 183.55 TaxID=1150837 RepID=A0A6A5R964_9PLEO|nr:uncharacterized protein M421DRAFT_425606 [Didymella exigua CBS 183.55]KAF1923718.1 hypothetical protein M421DRAFT_425606 [Didymella exigua CBS 183.55]